ncbi:MAG: YaiO family outer membrane beta-barrel protein [Balneolaceae bacterium]
MKQITLHTLLLYSLLATIHIQNGFAQQITSVDSSFQQARELAFDGEREEARELARAILEIAPDYHDVRILIARTYSWDQQYDDARRELEIVLDAEPGHLDALSAAIDNELWGGQPQQAVIIATDATRRHPTNENLLLKRVEAHIASGQESEARQILNLAEQLNPRNEQIQELRRRITISGQNYTLSASFTYDQFSDIFDPWKNSYLQLGRSTPIGTVIARLNYADRFGSTGIQPEIDFYPGIADGLYAYLNFGYTTSTLYPGMRIGGELYKRLPGGFEASFGFRHMRFESSDITIFTGSLSAYYRTWYLSIRPYLTPGSSGLSRSFNLTLRRYLDGPGNYITIRGGFGFSPEERRFQDVSGEVFLVRSQYVGLGLFKALRHNLTLFGSVDGARQELRFDPGRYIRVFTFNIGTQIKF